MSFSDVIKKSVLNEVSVNDISVQRILIVMAIAILCAAYIFVIYFIYTKKSFYNRNFNITLAGVSIVTTGIVLALQSNFVISLGMVGALSIVRFRTAIKEPLDLLFLFWSISTGIICGAGIFSLAIIIALLISLILFALQMTPLGRASMLLVINYEGIERENAISECVKKYNKNFQVKTRNITYDKNVSMIIELRIKEQMELLKEISEIEGVKGISLVSHDGEVNF